MANPIYIQKTHSTFILTVFSLFSFFGNFSVAQINPKDTIGIRDLKMAYSTYCLASDLIDKMRQGYKAEGSKLFLGEKATGIYDKSIRTSMRLYGILKEEKYHMALFFGLTSQKASTSESKAACATGTCSTTKTVSKIAAISVPLIALAVWLVAKRKQKKD